MKHNEYIVPIGEEAKEFDEMFIGVIRRQPVLIRCKDCKHHYFHELMKQDYCDIPNMQFGEIDPNGYCHRAEGKEDKEE